LRVESVELRKSSEILALLVSISIDVMKRGP